MLRRSIALSGFILVSLFPVGCKTDAPVQQKEAVQAPAMKAAPATPIAEKKEELGGKTWDPQWDAVVEQALSPDMLSPVAARAVRSFCPNFGNEAEADKRAFWAYLFQAMAGAEAGLDPSADVHHTEAVMRKTDTVTKRPIRQQGLLQLSYQDAEQYGCDLDWAKDRRLPKHDPETSILQPEKNLACGVKIMENQIITQKKPLIVRSSYWSTLQPGTVSYRVFAKQMANVPDACKVAVTKHTRRHQGSSEAR
jgi:hypothetical protein